jgi:AcrR family transcriptional regulator
MTEPGTADRVASAALAILVAEGAAAVTMRRVAADAGVTTMATYRHFPSREVLLRSVADSAFAELGKTWSRWPESMDFTSRIGQLQGDYLDFALGRPNLYRFLILDRQLPEARRFPEDFADGGSPLLNPVMETVELGMREGALRADDLLEVTLAVITPAMGLVQLYLGGRIGLSENDFRALVERTTRRVLDGIRH